MDDAGAFSRSGATSTVESDGAGREPRESTFLKADVHHGSDRWSVRVRNISAGGMMVDPAGNLVRGDVVEVEMDGVGQVRATVAWADGKRMGLAFAEDIDPRAARKRVGGGAGERTVFVAKPLIVGRRPGLKIS